MGSNVFSDLTINNTRGLYAPQKYDNSLTLQKEKTYKNFIKETAPTALPIAAIPLSVLITHKYSAKNNKELIKELGNTLKNGDKEGFSSELKDELKNLNNKLNDLKSQTEKSVKELKESQSADREANKKNSDNSKVWSAVLAIAGLGGAYKAGELSASDKDNVIEQAKQRLDNISNTAQTAIFQSQIATSNSNLMTKYTQDVNGVILLNNPPIASRNGNCYKEAITEIEQAAKKRLNETPSVIPITKEHPTIWSVTSEFDPMKDGGLGAVPVAIQENLAKLNIDSPAFIPMYQQKGKAFLEQKDGKYIYNYGAKSFECKKAAAFQVDTFRNGKSQTENVEIYTANIEKDPNKPERNLVFIKNDNYFDGAIYQKGAKSEEAEKFAFFSKAVYEFAKMKSDARSVKNPQIVDEKAFNSIKEADGMILNDWQASPVAALMRYKAPMEFAHGELNKDAKNKLSNMNIITIGHNTKYQGSAWLGNTHENHTKEVTSNMLNTLFDNYTYDIVQHAKTGASEQNKDDKGLEKLDNVLLIDQNDKKEIHTNLLNMGVCLSDYFCPVSKNFAKEILTEEHQDLSGELRWALTQRDGNGSLVGIINGNDFDKASVEAKKGFISSTAGFDYEMYNKNTPINDVMEARKHNKLNYYNNFMKAFTRVHGNDNDENVKKVRSIVNNPKRKLEFVETADKIKNLPDIDENTPVISSIGRLVDQKGVDIVSSAIAMLMNNWDNIPELKNHPKPIFYIGGGDGEGGKQRKFVENLQNGEIINKEAETKVKLENKDDANRIIFGHGFAPMTTMAAASDFFLLPSRFEPCGLTQGEAFAVGTPVIASSVGGIVDTLNRNGKNNGILTETEVNLTPEAFYRAMVKGLDIYFNDKERYKNMVNDSLHEDFSWIQPNKQGPIYEYLKLFGMDTDKLQTAA